MKVWFLVLILNLFFVAKEVCSKDSEPVQGIRARVERVGSMTHLEFSGQNEWDYEVKRDGRVLIMTLPKMDNISVQNFIDINSLLVEKIEVDNEMTNKTQLLITLSDEKVESFDYLIQKPSRLIVDFFVEDDKIIEHLKTKKENSLLAQKEKAKKLERKKRVAKKSDEKKSKGRAPASEFMTVGDGQVDFYTQEGQPPRKVPQNIQELYNFSTLGASTSDNSIEANVIEAQGNIYLRFPALKLKNPHLKELQSYRPQYEIKKSFSDENKQARTLLALFNQRSFASFIKAKQIFKKTFPNSTYDEILTYVEADTWIELWKLNKRQEYLNQAMNIYKMLIERHPKSPIAERTLINTGLLAHDVGEFFVATKMLKRYVKNYSLSPFIDTVKLYLADSLAQLKNYDGAYNILSEVIQTGESHAKIEAKYRMGDIFFLKQSFRRSEQAYLEALTEHPEAHEKYPNALFNMAEAQFNLAEYKNSLDSFKKFYETFPNHNYSAYALTRSGELVDIIYRDKQWAQGFYNESYYKYRDTMGGALARMRSLSQRFKNMKEKELKYAENEIFRLKKQVNLPNLDEFAAFMISDGYFGKKDYLKAAQALIEYFQFNPQPANIRKFEKRISRSIASQVDLDIDKRRHVQALSLIEKHQKSWLNKSQRVDIQMARAQIYESMGLYKEALSSYKRIERRLKELSGTREEVERRVFENYPTHDIVSVRKAVTYYEMGEKKASIDALKDVKNILALKSNAKFDYYFTLSQFSGDNKNYQDALKALLLIEPSLISNSEQNRKYSLYLADLYEKNKDYENSISVLEKYLLNIKNEDDEFYVKTRIFSIQLSLSDKQNAIKTGEELFAKYTTKRNLDKERYYLGNLYFQTDQLNKAKETWKSLPKKSMWAELAKNKEESSEWSKRTAKSLEKIPAMQK